MPKAKGHFLSILIKATCMNNKHNIGSRTKIKNTTQVISSHCKTLNHLHQLHAHCLVSGRNDDVFLNAFLHTLISLLISSLNLDRTRGRSIRSLTYAVSLFNLVRNPTTFTFNNVIRAHTILSLPSPSSLSPLVFFARMRRLALPPDSHTFPFALAACAKLDPTFSLPFSQALHSQALKTGFSDDSFVLNSLIRVYALSGCSPSALRVFDQGRPHRDVVSYNILIDHHVKSGDITSARQLFDEMLERDSVSWGTIIAGYSQSKNCDEAISLFHEMVKLGFIPDSVALVAALSACAKLGDLDRGRDVHEYIKRNGIRLNPFLTTGLVDFYAKCGCIDIAKEIFDTRASSEKSLCAWNAMIVGFAMHGLGELSLSYFRRMTKEGIKPDGVTFLGVLVGCSHSGLVEQAQELFYDMERCYMVPKELKHYGCMADLLGRAGRIHEAMDMIRAMPMWGDVYVWGGLLAGCRLHAGNVEVAEEAAGRVMELRPEDGGVYSIMAGVYASAEQWDDVVRIRRWKDSKRAVKRNAGCSLIRLGGVSHEFVAGDDLHPQSHEIYSLLNGIEKHQLEAF
ncbi:hypothetical protein L484_011606 [Morus notabilis]|uniref:Pentatricopeptide repeat-containing protein n=1 Tax=Morus notabilis TaxID=981085 RepID=W9RZ44_9ROSA|nr:pentatricopeptide repeat-containing protein At5g61800 [Morus notabilis]EXB79413.1 hypothetical protein L484_011606 [Morus notabilis]